MASKRVKSKVVMLPTDKLSNILINTYITPHHNSSSIQIRFDLESYESAIQRGFKPQHLHFTVKEEIRVNDYFYDPLFKMIHQCTKIGPSGIIYANGTSECFGSEEEHERIIKIVGTTDEDLTINNNPNPKIHADYYKPLPKPTLAFLFKYAEAGGIDEVILDYEDMSSETYGEMKGYALKVDPKHNTMTIHPVRNSFTQEELIGAVSYGYIAKTAGFTFEEMLDKFKNTDYFN